MVDDQKVVDSPSLWRTRQGTRFILARFGNGRWQVLSISFGFPRPRSSLPEDTLLPRRIQTIPSDAEITRISVSSRLKDHEDGQYSCPEFAVHFHSNFQSRTTSARQSYLPCHGLQTLGVAPAHAIHCLFQGMQFIVIWLPTRRVLSMLEKRARSTIDPMTSLQQAADCASR